MASRALVKFLEKSLDQAYQLRTAYDYKASFLLGSSGVLFVVAVNNFFELPFALLTIFSLLTAAGCIYSIVLPYRKIKLGNQQSLFCWWGVKGKKYQDYLAALKNNVNNSDDAVSQYSREIYSLYYNSLRYKSILLKISASFLFLGLLSCLATIAWQ